MNGQKILRFIRRLRTAGGLLACAVALLAGLPAGAQERGGAASEPVQGVVVRGIEIDGSRRIDANAIRAVLVTELGVPVTRARIAEDVRRIYDLGFFRDIRVSARRVPGGQVLTYFVVEQPIIRRVTVIGNENIDSEDLQDQLTLTVGSTIDYPLLIENRARIEGLYQSKGYYLASVAYQIEELAEGSVSVNFEITEGAKVRLREIDFVGNESLDDDDLRRVMQTKQ